MPNLHWDKAKNFFDPRLMGALPDLFITDTTVEDWQKVFDLVLRRGWDWKFQEGTTERPLPTAAEALNRPADAEVVVLRVWPTPGISVIFRPWTPTEINFDIDLRELHGQQGVDSLCRLLRDLGRELGKPVTMTAEGGRPEHAVLGYDPVGDRVVLLADPLAPR
ncbi:hypothetical protein [Actinomadura rupiterrae]|uniref:hypothetical protein n=1 Tax=Actinomadura rupiterrae TaxID=559627 RepID=UPI0020A2D043|nr:hypothetical protein [Actinomadura rupiterrae]MCP2342255.1 hypothetical protein [Actinomadura rupiterrae]